MTSPEAGKPHALIVGASSGVGYALAERLSASYRVTALARRIERLQPLEAVGVRALRCDVSEPDQIASTLDEAVAAGGKITCLVYCAGLQSIKPMRMLRDADIRNVIDVNLTGALTFGRLMASQRVSEPESVFCAVSSIAAHRPEPAIVPYAVAKAGLEALIKGMARELAPRRAVGVAPGWLDTDMTRGFEKVYNTAFKENLARVSPRGIVTVEAVVDLVEFLVSPRAGFITGQIVTIDGGASL
ncbi:SDR family oxidoreductase [Roseomonas hellenica]|nr:SDR family oxidoreductase [Plastoroseomonas hellenica]MBR0642197.1 SDR family oxidoreductase [Plastoroseomonas hellenica]